MIRKIVLGFLITLLLSLQAPGVTAQSSSGAVFLLGQQCEAQQAKGKIGFDAKGTEVIVFQVILEATRNSSDPASVLTPLVIQPNTAAYSNLTIAKNQKSTVGDAVRFEVEGGFTQQQGKKIIDDLLYLQGVSQLPVNLKVISGQLIPKDSINNIYQSAQEQFQIQPSTCRSQTASSTTASNAVTIQLTSNKSQVAPAEEAILTAEIQGRTTEQIEWIQTSEPRLPSDPTISSRLETSGKTISTLTFPMPEQVSFVDFKVKVGTVTQTLRITSSGGTLKSAAPTDDSPTDAELSLQERLRQRRLEQDAADTAAPETPVTEPSGTLHSAAGVDLTQSGPADTALLVLLSLVILWGWRRIFQNSISE